MKTSLITIVTRKNHLLDRQAEVIRESSKQPDEWIIVSLGDEAKPSNPPIPAHTRRIASASKQAIAAAYAEGVRRSIGARLVFLDGNCLPMADVFAAFASALDDFDALWICRIRELTGNSPALLQALARETLHQRRKGKRPKNAQLLIDRTKFRSDCFAISRTNYRSIGGFDPAFTGWDTEDVDFAFAAEEASVALGIVDADAISIGSSILEDPGGVPGMLQAARAFRSKWGVWPRLTALRSLAIHGFIEFNAARDHLRLLRLPTAAELQRVFTGPIARP